MSVPSSSDILLTMHELARLVCDAQGHIVPEGFRAYVQRAEAFELQAICGAHDSDHSSSKPSATGVGSAVLPASWYHWLALIYLNLNTPIMAQAALARLAAVSPHRTDDAVARYLWSACNHHVRCHYDMAFDHVRRASDAQASADAGPIDSWARQTSTALIQHTLNTIAVRQYCSYRAFCYADQDTAECLASCAALLTIPVTALQERLAQWTAIDDAIDKQCGTVLNTYGRPWSPYDAFGTGTEEPVRSLPDAYVRTAINNAALATLKDQS